MMDKQLLSSIFDTPMEIFGVLVSVKVPHVSPLLLQKGFLNLRLLSVARAL